MSEKKANVRSFLDGDRVRIKRLSSAKQYNGKLGAIKSYDESKQRYVVLLDNAMLEEKKLLQVKEQNLEQQGKSFRKNDVFLCSGCMQRKPFSERKLCTGCNKSYFCSADCQREHWKSHKAECNLVRKAREDYEKEMKAKERGDETLIPPESQGWRIRATKAISTLQDVLMRQGIAFFRNYFDLAVGRGVLLLMFETPEKCEDFTQQMVILSRDMNSFTHLELKAHFRKWPQGDPSSYSGGVNSRKVPGALIKDVYLDFHEETMRGIDFAVESYNPSQEGVIYFVVNQFKGSPECSIGGARFGFSGTGNQNLVSKRTPKEEKCSQALVKLGCDLKNSPKYLECRKAMLDLQKVILASTTPSIRRAGGIFVIRNIFNPKESYFEMKDVKAISPKLLLKAIRKTFNGGTLSWGRAVHYVLLGEPRQLPGLHEYEEPNVNNTTVTESFNTMRASVSKRLGVSADKVMDTNFFFATAAFLDPQDDRLIYQFSDSALHNKE